jgi:serine/threonine-protein kinase RsbT
MSVAKSEMVPVTNDGDVVNVRQRVRGLAVEIKLSLVEQTKVVTAASELGRNLLVHGGGGEVRLDILCDGVRHGLRAIFEDRGPGIPDIEQAMKDGFTTGTGMGLGLGGARRLVNEFEIVSNAAEGTRVTITKWREFPFRTA